MQTRLHKSSMLLSCFDSAASTPLISYTLLLGMN